jgi:carotenoid cleavage dioxygenase-like enzyme
VIGTNGSLALPMSGSLPPDLQGTLFRVGPAWPWDASSRIDAASDVGDAGLGGDGDEEDGGAGGGGVAGALHAVEIRDGQAVWYQRQESAADAGVFWHAGSVLALPEAGIPLQYSRFLEPQEFAGGLTVPIASHVHRLAADGGRILFGVDDGSHESGGDVADGNGIFLRVGEWDATGALRSAQSVELERSTWQHDIGVTRDHVVFIESPTSRVTSGPGAASPVPFGWVPGAEGWIGVVRRGGGAGGEADADGVTDGAAARWIRLDPCLVTHVLGAYDEPDGAIVLFVCCYGVPEAGQSVDTSASVVGRPGLALSGVGGTLGVLERWRITGERVERVQVDERFVEYPRMDSLCEGAAFRFGYALETAWEAIPSVSGVPAGAADRPDRWTAEASPVGLLKFDLSRNEIASWSPGPGRTPSEPLFVRATDGHSDEEGWLLAIVDDANRRASDLYVLDASSLGRRRPEAVIHLPVRLPVRSHGEWVPADRYR